MKYRTQKEVQFIMENNVFLSKGAYSIPSIPYVIFDDLKCVAVALLSLNIANILKLILFGSYANGTYQYDSDLNICVVVDKMPDRHGLTAYRNIDVICDISRVIDVLLCTDDKLQRGELIFEHIRKDGITLYERQ